MFTTPPAMSARSISLPKAHPTGGRLNGLGSIWHFGISTQLHLQIPHLIFITSHHSKRSELPLYTRMREEGKYQMKPSHHVLDTTAHTAYPSGPRVINAPRPQWPILHLISHTSPRIPLPPQSLNQSTLVWKILASLCGETTYTAFTPTTVHCT